MSFTEEIYEAIRGGAQRSAARIVPLVYDLVRPESVVDVGCGEGWFARRFAEEGVPEVLGLDESVSGLGTEEMLDNESVLWFRRASLPDDLARLERRFDLGLCLEVGEHLAASAAVGLVEGLTAVAPVVLFSAAIPGQGGHGHLNEQPPAYWSALFRERGFACADWPRWEIWDDESVEPWYAQNVVLYGEPERLRRLGFELVEEPPYVVHPRIFAWKLG